MRLLIRVPIIHGAQDMGSLLAQTRQDYLGRFGHEKWLEHLKSIDQFWDDIRQTIAALELPCASLRLYQDGLPVCGKEEVIAREVAGQGSKNHILLLELVAKGAQLMGTEDPALLLQEYQLHQAGPPGTQRNDDPTRQQEQGRKLLIERDQFIAQRIHRTLLTDEIGLLFLGLAHNVEPLLNPDILVKNLFPSLRALSGAPA